MKKFISMVMAAAMVVSLVPATAFAKGTVEATARIVDAAELDKNDDGVVFDGNDGPELRLKLTEVTAQKTTDGKLPTFEVELSLDNAEFNGYDKNDSVFKSWLESLVTVYKDGSSTALTGGSVSTTSGTSTPASVTVDGTFSNPATQAELDAALKSSDGIGDGTTVAEYKSWADLRKEIGKTAAQKIADYKAMGYELVTDATGDYYVHPKTGDKSAEVSTIVDDTELDLLAVVNKYVTAGKDDYVTYTAATTGKDSETLSDVFTVEAKDFDKDSVTFKFTFDPDHANALAKDDIISIDLRADMVKYTEGKQATVSVDGIVKADDLVYASVLSKGLKASVKKVVDIAEEEVVKLNEKGLKIESVIGDLPRTLSLKISKGFEFTNKCELATGATVEKIDDNELEVTVPAGVDEITIEGLEIEATTAKSGAVATITVKSAEKNNTSYGSASVEVAKVVDYKVVLSVDEDEDIPVIYSGVNVNNDGITDDSDHLSLEVTAEETFPGAWSFRKGFNFELPEGVYVTNVDVTDTDGILRSASSATQATANYVTEDEVAKEFYNAYQDGDHLNFEFDKRVFDDVDATLNDDVATMTFQLELVADPTFEGDVVLKLTGDLVDTQEVTIAKFVKPYTVKAEQNDMIIDYRYTEVPTTVTITEAEAGLWDKGATFTFTVDDNDTDLIVFEDGEFEVDKDSELELKDYDDVDKNGATFVVKSVSDEAATVTLKNMSLFMQRNIPAGPYDLKISTSLAEAYEAQPIFAADEGTFADDACTGKHDDDKECFVGDVCDYSSTVKEAFINVVTAGRDVDDASFTTKVVVPVGESYLIAGEKEVALDVPAYINADGYTMLPVRAVATALGINNSNVLWDQATKTVTILYGQRIITMVAGQKVVYVNGSAIPASASVEITNDRTFLPMRDLGTALGVTDITWDAATRTATLNGNQK